MTTSNVLVWLRYEGACARYVSSLLDETLHLCMTYDYAYDDRKDVLCVFITSTRKYERVQVNEQGIWWCNSPLVQGNRSMKNIQAFLFARMVQNESACKFTNQ